ncbi:hypothetical protein EDD32_0239 [Georgenia muralis]|uniref:Uncharacterized protein n=1 Tax=Georgenia muralis TaxID=154117 RepID=A0A3N4Z2H3_9MICO|nr:hypothetical protein EDD32_0239 [Georgenia muralis]
MSGGATGPAGAGPDGRVAPVEGIGDDTVASFHAQVAQAARDRAGSWDVVAEILDGPDASLAERLRSGELATRLRLAARWLGGDAEIFAGDLMRLDVHARGARRRSLDADLASLAADHHLLGDDVPGLVAGARQIAAACHEEAAAWAAGDTAGGRSLRAREQELIAGRLLPALPDAAGRLARDGASVVTRALGSLVLAVLSVESGRDYQRAVLRPDA